MSIIQFFPAAPSGAAGFVNSTFIRILGIYLQIPRRCDIINLMDEFLKFRRNSWFTELDMSDKI